MPLFIIGAILIFYVLLKSPGSVPVSEPGQAKPTLDPAVIHPQVTDFTNKIAFDIQTGEAKNLKTGETILASSFAAVAGVSQSFATSGTTLLFSATSWTIIGAFVVGAFAVIMALRSNVHLYANALVQNYENPFGDFFIKSIQAVQAGVPAHTLSSDDVSDIYNALNTSWSNYRLVLLDLMSRSEDWLIVTKQSLNNLDNEYQGERLPNGKVLGLGQGGAYPDGFVTTWLSWLRTQIVYLQSIGE